jgi:ribosome-associated heat shock protein Hsp15
LDRQRIDKWLWHARMVRTRSAAAALAEAGYVRLNGKRVTAPSHLVRIGDVVTLALDRAVKVIQVEGFCEKRGRAPAARALYRDLTTSSGAKACTKTGVPRKVSRRKGRST